MRRQDVIELDGIRISRSIEPDIRIANQVDWFNVSGEVIQHVRNIVEEHRRHHS